MKDGLGTARLPSVAGATDEIALLDGLFKAKPLLDRIEARRAYALIALAHPQVTAQQWHAFTRRYARAPRERRGLVAVRDQRRCVHIVFRYAVDVSPLIGHGRTLRLHDVVMAQLPGHHHVLVPALAACAECLAAGLGCSAVALEVPVAASAAREADALGRNDGAHATVALQAAGFWMAAAKMVRNFAT